MLIGIWVTTDCNLNCRYCYEGSEKIQETMTNETVDQIVEFIRRTYQGDEKKPLIIEFHGGEPLLNYQIIPYLVQKIEADFKNVLFGITTNGILLTEERIIYLAEKMTYGFSLSIDGDKLSHDTMRIDRAGYGTYDQVVKKVSELLKKRKDIRARMTYVPATVGRLSNNIIHLIQLGFQNIVAAPDYCAEDWSSKEMDILLAEMESIRSYYDTHASQLEGVRISILEDRFKQKGFCQGGKSNFHILPNGDIYPCSYGVGEEEFKLGNVLKQELYTSKIENLDKVNKEILETCQGCNGYVSCVSTRCKIFNKVLTGNFLKPVPVICAIQHVKQKFFANSSK